uniref:DUF3480 domain-containing protein n=1 Tax=Macrostomum lignano TaxID=282301 RepID=A0A1I8FF60_9PLAT
VQSICQNLDSRPNQNDNSTFGNIHLPLFIDSRILPNSKRHYSQISCGFDLDYRPGYSILLRISHNLGFEDIDFYCHSKLRRDSNSPGNWIEEQLEMCHGYSIGSLGTKSRLLIDGSVGISLLALKNDMMERLAGPGMDALHAAVTKKLALNTISRSALLPGAAVPLPEHTEMRQAMDRESNSWLVRLELSNFDFSCPCHDCDAYGQHMTVGRKAAGAAAPPGVFRVLYMALTADLPDIQISYSAIETGINVSVTFIDCNRNASLRQCRMARTQVVWSFLAIVLTLLLLGCLLFINREVTVWQPEFTAVLQLRQSRTETTLQLTTGRLQEMSRTPATGSHRLVGKSRRLVRQRDIEQSQQHSTEERLARPLTRQRGEEAEVADVDFVLQEAPQRIRRCDGLLRPEDGLGPTAHHGLSRLGQTDLLLLLEHIAIDNAAPADPVALFAGVLKKAKEGSTVATWTTRYSRPASADSSEASTPAGCCTSWRAASAFTASYTRPTLAACWPAGWCTGGAALPAALANTAAAEAGREDGVYPCGLISNRYRPPVFYEPARSVMSMFREAVPHLSEGLVPRLRDCNLTLESNGIVVVSISGRRQADLASLLSVYAPDTDGVLALAGELCQSADAHLVARESPGGEFLKPSCSPLQDDRRSGRLGDCPATAGVTGLGFIALSTRLGAADQQGCFAAIVEDGLGVICSRQDMWSLL